MSLSIDKSGTHIAILLKNGADAGARDKEGMAPLMFTYGLEIVEDLINNGAKVNARDKEGRTPLMNTYRAEIGMIIQFHQDL